MESSFTPVSILAAGCIIPSGPSLPLVDVAERTRLRLLRWHPSYVDQCGFPVRLSIFPSSLRAVSRWMELAHAALFDLAGRLPPLVQPHLQHSEVLLWLALPEEGRPGVPIDLAEKMMDTLAPRWTQLRLSRGQHTVAAGAILEASSWVARNGHPAIVLAIDTPYDGDTLRWLECNNLLHGARRAYRGQARANPYGRVPGEGAAAILLAPMDQAGAWCHLIGVAKTRPPTASPTGTGLSVAARRALELARVSASSVTQLMDDANGDADRADEFGIAVLRLTDYLADNWRRSTPALAAGDLSSAGFAAHTALAAWRLRQPASSAADEFAMVLGSSDDAERAALVLKSTHQEERK
ncbi:MAG: beta-ketoacyl synthase [Candidatus Accumulibacter sp.]|nr:beta-ketoacyl synthase [Accumulibacter sp.]